MAPTANRDHILKEQGGEVDVTDVKYHVSPVDEDDDDCDAALSILLPAPDAVRTFHPPQAVERDNSSPISKDQSYLHATSTLQRFYAGVGHNGDQASVVPPIAPEGQGDLFYAYMILDSAVDPVLPL